LYRYITADLHKQVILVLNKADLCPPPLVIAWKHYMTSQFPHLEIVCFTSHPGQSYNTVDLSSWEQKIHRDAVAERLELHDEGAESVLVEHQSDSALEMSNQELYKDGVLTLGCI
ncbi:hypothetical protein GOODEAATRI_033822, partial [Goodea atripinnis]